MTQPRSTTLGSWRSTWCLSASTWPGRWCHSSSTCTGQRQYVVSHLNKLVVFSACWTLLCRSRWSSPWMTTWQCSTDQWRPSTTPHLHNMNIQTRTGTMTSKHGPWSGQTFIRISFSIFMYIVARPRKPHMRCNTWLNDTVMTFDTRQIRELSIEVLNVQKR